MKETPTKQKLLDTSRHLIMSKGYNATSVDEICKLAEVTKGAFFYYFKSKEALGISVLNDYWATRQRQFATADWMAAEHPRQQLEGFLAVVADVFMNDPDGFSCLAGSFSQELATTHPLFRSMVADLFAAWAEQIKPVLHAAAALTTHPDQIDVDLLADYIIVVIEGALVLALARQNGQVIEQHLNLLNAHLQGVFRA